MGLNGNSKVTEHDCILCIDQHVCRFDIAMNDFSIMGELKCRGDLRQIGIDESLSGVKSAQREVVSEEVEEIKKLLADLLALARGHGTLLDTISGQGREAAGLLFHVLRTVFNIEELSQDFLARPALEGAGKDEEAITETFSEAESEWTKETLNVIESVRNQVNSATV